MTDKPAPPKPKDDQDKELQNLQGAALPPFEGLNLGQKSIKALEAMAYEGLSLPIAAERNEMIVGNLNRAFNLPKVRRAYNQIVAALKQNEGLRAYMRIVRLSQVANSDHVKLEANKWIAGVDGIAALKRVEGKFSHTHAFGGFDYPDPEPIDVTPTEPDPDIQSVDGGE